MSRKEWRERNRKTGNPPMITRDREKMKHRGNAFYRLIIRRDLCALCGEKNLRGSRILPQTIDHLVPIRIKGRNCWWNLAPMCSDCNNVIKGGMTLLEALLKVRRDSPDFQPMDSGHAIDDSLYIQSFGLPTYWKNPLHALLAGEKL